MFSLHGPGYCTVFGDPDHIMYPSDPESDVPFCSHGPGGNPSSICGPRAFPSGRTGESRLTGTLLPALQGCTRTRLPTGFDIPEGELWLWAPGPFQSWLEAVVHERLELLS